MMSPLPPSPAPGQPPAWHGLTPDEALAHWRSDADAGLSVAEAAERLRRHGPNTLPGGGSSMVFKSAFAALRLSSSAESMIATRRPPEPELRLKNAVSARASSTLISVRSFPDFSSTLRESTRMSGCASWAICRAT